MGGQCCAEKNSKDGEVVEKRFDKTIGMPVKSEDQELDDAPEDGANTPRSQGDAADPLQKVKVGQEFTVIIPDRKGMKLGIDTCASKFYSAFNIIKIKTDGLIAQWNRDHPDKEVKEGDDLMEVNGVRGDEKKICELLGKAKSLQIQVQRNS
mmetsp:Transcript_80969/g.229243  ORF Transcript_80969/g.229243 Transcript_80969/m.229243 type:complete len:152 (-) Transcript_80969:360-815(-)